MLQFLWAFMILGRYCFRALTGESVRSDGRGAGFRPGSSVFMYYDGGSPGALGGADADRGACGDYESSGR